MKKTLFFMIILAVFATGCKKEKSKALNYNDTDPIEMVLQGNHQIKVSSDYDVSYTAINNSDKTVITVSGGGNLYGKNVGTAQVKMSNSYQEKTVDVNVTLFQEPTFDFGCGTDKIKKLYGQPYASGFVSDTILAYQYTQTPGYNGNYSFACGEMDFFFYDGVYFESDLYIRPQVEYLLNNYLDENFNFSHHILDTITNDTVFIYHNKIDEDVICGRRLSHNTWNEIILFYFRNDGEKSDASILKRHPRSSKLRY